MSRKFRSVAEGNINDKVMASLVSDAILMISIRLSEWKSSRFQKNTFCIIVHLKIVHLKIVHLK